MNDLEYVFWGLTWSQLFLAAGRYLLMVSAALLLLKHVVWFARGYHTQPDRGPRAVWRAGIEAVVSGVVAILYVQQLYFDGSILRLERWESAVQVWAFAALFMALVITRGESRPPPDAHA